MQRAYLKNVRNCGFAYLSILVCLSSCGSSTSNGLAVGSGEYPTHANSKGIVKSSSILEDMNRIFDLMASPQCLEEAGNMYYMEENVLIKVLGRSFTDPDFVPKTPKQKEFFAIINQSNQTIKEKDRYVLLDTLFSKNCKVSSDELYDPLLRDLASSDEEERLALKANIQSGIATYDDISDNLEASIARSEDVLVYIGKAEPRWMEIMSEKNAKNFAKFEAKVKKAGERFKRIFEKYDVTHI